jgi:HD-GYP domain-containing protein (c-di-GMP phosphodiesterase class II)
VLDDEQLTLADLVTAAQLRLVLADAVAQAPIGMRVIDTDGRPLVESHPQANPCPQLLVGAAGSSRCPHGSTEMTRLAAGGEVFIDDRCPFGALRRAHPLRYRDRLWAALVSCSHNGAPHQLFDAVTCLTAGRLSDLIVAGFELQSLSREIVANYEQLTLLYNASVEVGGMHDIGSICQRLLDRLEAQIPSEAMAVLLLDEESGHARAAAARGDLTDAFQTPMPDMSDGILSYVLSTGRVAVVCDVPRPGGETSSVLCVPLMHDAGSEPPSERRDLPTRSALAASFGSSAMPSGRDAAEPARSLAHPTDQYFRAPDGDLAASAERHAVPPSERLMGAICVRDKLSGEEYLAADEKLVSAMAAQAAVAISNTLLFGDVKSLFVGTVRSLASAVDAKDPYTLGHSQRVTQYALTIAQELGLSSAACEDLQLAALLHDVGKIGLPDEILLKAGKLTADEWEQVRKHPIWGEEILRPIRQLRRVASWIRHEHERWNGNGYPDGLKGADIPLASRIIAVADAFDALTSDRSYRKAVSLSEAIAILESAAATEYDPDVIAAFLAAVGSGEISK